MVRLLRRSRGTLYRDLQAGTMQPPPNFKFPYRWLKGPVVEYFERERTKHQTTVPALRAPRRRRRAR